MAAPAPSKQAAPSSFGFGQTATDADAASSNPIKLVVYDFDQTLSSMHLYHELQGKRAPALAKLSDERLLFIFGGKERLARLVEHLTRVSSKCELAILSFGWCDVIKAALRRMALDKFFENSVIIGNDSEELRGQGGNKASCIKRMKKKRALKTTQVMFVDDDMANISKAHSCCVTVAVQPRQGMSEQHMKHIEEQCRVYPSAAQLQMELTTPKTVKQQISKHYPANSTEQPKAQGKDTPAKAAADGLARFRIDPQKAALLDADVDNLVTETPVIQIGGDQTPHSDSEYELNVPMLSNELECIKKDADEDQDADKDDQEQQDT